MPEDRTTSPGSETTNHVIAATRNVHVRYRSRVGRSGSLRALFARGRSSTGHDREVHAVRGITLDIHEGEIIGLVGSNGAGKSTLLRALAGLIPTAEGEVYARSIPVLLGVDAAMHKRLTGRDNILLGCSALGMTQRQAREAQEEIIEFSGLSEAIDRALYTYSSGMKARLQFSIASSVSPDILLIDEAFAVGDKDFRARADERLKRLKAEAGAVILVSHNLDVLERMSTRTIWVEEGRVVVDGATQDVLEAYRDGARDGQTDGATRAP